MELGLEEKVAWVHGASAGLGRASARALALEGAAVALSARRGDALEEAAAEIRAAGGRAVAVPLDVTDAGAIDGAARRVVSELGPVDVLLSNAGGPSPGRFDALDDAALNAAFALTVASAWRLTKAVLPQMRARRSGCLLYLTSLSTKEPVPNLLLSNMLRAAVVALMKTVSKESGRDGVRALCVAPGIVRTARATALEDVVARTRGTTPADVRAETEAAIPARRYGEPDEFGDVVAFLASERASYVSGVSVAVDGGRLDGIAS